MRKTVKPRPSVSKDESPFSGKSRGGNKSWALGARSSQPGNESVESSPKSNLLAEKNLKQLAMDEEQAAEMEALKRQKARNMAVIRLVYKDLRARRAEDASLQTRANRLSIKILFNDVRGATRRALSAIRALRERYGDEALEDQDHLMSRLSTSMNRESAWLDMNAGVDERGFTLSLHNVVEQCGLNSEDSRLGCAYLYERFLEQAFPEMFDMFGRPKKSENGDGSNICIKLANKKLRKMQFMEFLPTVHSRLCEDVPKHLQPPDYGGEKMKAAGRLVKVLNSLGGKKAWKACSRCVPDQTEEPQKAEPEPPKENAPSLNVLLKAKKLLNSRKTKVVSVTEIKSSLSNLWAKLGIESSDDEEPEVDLEAGDDHGDTPKAEVQEQAAENDEAPADSDKNSEKTEVQEKALDNVEAPAADKEETPPDSDRNLILDENLPSKSVVLGGKKSSKSRPSESTRPLESEHTRTVRELRKESWKDGFAAPESEHTGVSRELRNSDVPAPESENTGASTSKELREGVSMELKKVLKERNTVTTASTTWHVKTGSTGMHMRKTMPSKDSNFTAEPEAAPTPPKAPSPLLEQPEALPPEDPDVTLPVNNLFWFGKPLCNTWEGLAKMSSEQRDQARTKSEERRHELERKRKAWQERREERRREDARRAKENEQEVDLFEQVMDEPEKIVLKVEVKRPRQFPTIPCLLKKTHAQPFSSDAEIAKAQHCHELVSKYLEPMSKQEVQETLLSLGLETLHKQVVRHLMQRQNEPLPGKLASNLDVDGPVLLRYLFPSDSRLPRTGMTKVLRILCDSAVLCQRAEVNTGTRAKVSKQENATGTATASKQGYNMIPIDLPSPTEATLPGTWSIQVKDKHRAMSNSKSPSNRIKSGAKLGREQCSPRSQPWPSTLRQQDDETWQKPSTPRSQAKTQRLIIGGTWQPWSIGPNSLASSQGFTSSRKFGPDSWYTPPWSSNSSRKATQTQRQTHGESLNQAHLTSAATEDRKLDVMPMVQEPRWTNLRVADANATI
eukprot:gnl/MRDRNA2_/MRDRNA2_34478_c0_seq1.p1 gnl/MRDRNA2_/MRDRNA2_34478_c0~~gnl/MRDRNA2_/MRDRNA2_34478_c0_seq1.p1  ORF type:complete len:1017 (-),score=208.29 gnl/MRDRNA2_/MRDRNA2_34478_c0_seq1:9-3059(-)